jgi:hypothetical protein
MAFIITILDYIWGSYYFLFVSMIIIFISAAIISYVNYYKNGKKRGFLKFYFLAMILALAAWIINSVTAAFLSWEKSALIFVYGLNIIIFFLFLYGIIYITKKPGKI